MTIRMLGTDRRPARDEADDPRFDAGDELLKLLREELGDDTPAFRKAEELVAFMLGHSPDGQRIAPPGGRMRAAEDRHAFAMDAADPVRRVADWTAARQECEPLVGQILAADSASAVFREALRRLGVNTRELPAAGLPAVWRAHARQRRHDVAAGGGLRPAAVVTSDAGADRSFAKRFPDAAGVRVL